MAVEEGDGKRMAVEEGDGKRSSVRAIPETLEVIHQKMEMEGQ
jgi:hypothetical protein